MDIDRSNVWRVNEDRYKLIPHAVAGMRTSVMVTGQEGKFPFGRYFPVSGLAETTIRGRMINRPLFVLAPRSNLRSKHVTKLFTELMLAAPMSAGSGYETYLEVSFKELIFFLFPKTWHRPTQEETLMQAIRSLDRTGWFDVSEGMFIPFRLVDQPETRAKMSDLFMFQVSFPKAQGALVNREIVRDLYSEGPSGIRELCVNMYASLAYSWDKYGTQKGRLVDDERKYPVFDADDLVQLAYGNVKAELTKPHARMRRTRAKRALDHVTEFAECRVIDTTKYRNRAWQVLPSQDHFEAYKKDQS